MARKKRPAQNKTLDAKIKQAENFIEVWLKYHNIYKTAISKPSISVEDEQIFLDIKRLLQEKYKALEGNLGLRQLWDVKAQATVTGLLNLQGLLALSDVQITQLDTDWKISLGLFNELLADLEKNRSQSPRDGPVKTFIDSVFRV